MSISNRYRRLAALASLLLASTLLTETARGQSSAYSPRLQPPRDARECGLISAEVLHALYDLTNEPEAIIEFLKGTELDRILKGLCDQGRYEEAFRLGKSYLDGFEKEKAAPRPSRTVAACLANDTVGDWIVNADAERYTISIFGKVISRQDPKKELAGGERLQRQAQRAMEPGSTRPGKLTSSGAGGSLSIQHKRGDARTLYRLDVGFVASGEPQTLDVELTPAGGETRRQKATLGSTNGLDVTPMMEDIKVGGVLRFKVDHEGATILVSEIPYPDPGKATYRGLQLQGRLARDLNAQRCVPRQCVLTTACCDLIGLPDDCFELRALRRYRDEVLLATSDGAEHIALYYALAPAILQSMRARDGERGLLRYYFSHILPCALLAWCGFDRAAFARYGDLVIRLCEAYLPQVARMARPGRQGSRMRWTWKRRRNETLLSPECAARPGGPRRRV